MLLENAVQRECCPRPKLLKKLGQHAHAKAARAPRCEHVPDAVADDDRGGDVDVKPVRSGQKQIRVGFGPLHVVSSDDGNRLRLDAQQRWP